MGRASNTSSRTGGAQKHQGGKTWIAPRFNLFFYIGRRDEQEQGTAGRGTRGGGISGPQSSTRPSNQRAATSNRMYGPEPPAPPMSASTPAQQTSLHPQQYSYLAPSHGRTLPIGQQASWEQQAQQSSPRQVGQPAPSRQEYGQQAMLEQQAHSSPAMQQAG